jgi:CheY-like chemotaxis protein
MTDIASGLKGRFDLAVLWFRERYEVLPDLTITDLSDEDVGAIEVLEALRNSVDAIPPSLISVTEELRDARPELFEKTLVHGVQVVGFGFSPASATEFVEVLNRTVQRDMAST